MYYEDVSEQDLRTAFGVLTDLATRVGARLYEASEDAPEMTPRYVEQTIRANLGLPPSAEPCRSVDDDPGALTRLRP